MSALLARHGPALMRVARQSSMCHDDAMDALQRALEIYVRRLDNVEVATEAAWLKVVIRHEAYAIRRSRGDCVAAPDVDLDAVIAAPDRSVEDRVLSGDRVSRSAQALRALKPDQARALMLKAHGLSYDEIGQHCGWTYTKVNRSITEGRRRFMEAYAELESGSVCERFAPALAALAAGAATSEQMIELRPHLRACTACRATVRDLHLSALRRVRVLGPIPAFGWLWERLRGGRMPDPAAVAPTHVERIDQLRPIERVRQDVTQLMHRAGNADVTTGIQIAATSGGGRVATLGAIVGLCLSGVGAGTVCVVRGVSPFGWLEPGPKPVHVRRAAPAPTAAPARAPVRVVAPPKLAAARLERRPTPSDSTPVRRKIAPPRRATRTSAADEVQQSEFGFEPASPPDPIPTRAPQEAAGNVDPVQEEFGP